MTTDRHICNKKKNKPCGRKQDYCMQTNDLLKQASEHKESSKGTVPSAATITRHSILSPAQPQHSTKVSKMDSCNLHIQQVTIFSHYTSCLHFLMQTISVRENYTNTAYSTYRCNRPLGHSVLSTTINLVAMLSFAKHFLWHMCPNNDLTHAKLSVITSSCVSIKVHVYMQICVYAHSHRHN